MRFMVVLPLLLLTPAVAPARPGPACLNLKQNRNVTLTGRLAMQTFPGSPNFESVADGDDPETVFILTLPAPICADDGEFIARNERFRTVHVFAEDDEMNPRLRRVVGQRVTISGEGFGAHTGHHHAPFVLSARAVRVAR